MRSPGNSRQRTWTVAISACLALIGSSCIEQTTEDARVSVTSGALGVQLNCGGLEIDTIGWAITRAGSPYRSGTFAVEGPGDNFSALITLLDPADDYTITLDAIATSTSVVRPSSTPCNGTADFAVQLGETTAVAVTLRCQDDSDGNRAHGLQCPGVDTIRALPGEAPLGKCVVLEAVADAIAKRAGSLSYRWAANGGILQDIVGPHAGFLCHDPGVATISVELHDSDPLCAARFPLYVTCRGAAERHKATSSGGSDGAAGSGIVSVPHK
jgi:hypothetical protein